MRQSEPQQPEGSEDPELDRLLMRADWPPPSIASTQRLTQQWQQLREQRPMRIWRPMLAIAASVGLVFAGSWMYSRPKPLPAVVAPAVQIAQIQIQSAVRDHPTTTLELAVLHIAKANKRVNRPGSSLANSVIPLASVLTGSAVPPTPRAVEPTPAARAESLAQSILREKNDDARDRLMCKLVSLGPANATPQVKQLLEMPAMNKSIVQALAQYPQGWSELLFSALNDPRYLVRATASAALAQIDGPVITARLISMANADVNRREAVAALVRIKSAYAERYIESAKRTNELGAIIRAENAQIDPAEIQQESPHEKSST